MFICDVKPGVSDVDLVVLCARIKRGVTKTGSPYLWLTLRDRTSDIDSRLWNVEPADEAKWKKGQIYKIHAQATVYNELPQLRIERFQPVAQTVELAKLVFPQAPINIENSFAQLHATVKSFKNQNYRKILLKLLAERGEEFKQWPAAVSHHHAVMGGLLWHSFLMLKTAQALQKIYDYLTLDWELLFAGVILHDFGKIFEINRSELRFTTEGMLIGHVSIMQAEIKVVAKQLNIDHTDVVLLQHMVIASHGKLEFGSPVPPRLIEAELLSIIDSMDARLYMINKALNIVTDGNTTPAIKALEFRSFLRHPTK